MTRTIAIAGKGGTGKSTVASLIIGELLADNKVPILGVDADPNATLNEWLQVEIPKTLGDLEAEVLNNKDQIPAGMDKRRYVEHNLQMALAENRGFDLLAMGRTEGPGCYCYVNDILRSYMDDLTPNYEYVVMDNEAGMEHISRRTTRDIDVLFIISDESPIGVRSAGRIYELEKSLEINIKETHLVINRVHQKLPELVHREVNKTGLDLLATIPVDEQITEFSFEGKSLLDIPESSPARKEVKKMLAEVAV